MHQRYPLDWPTGYPRTASPQRNGNFKSKNAFDESRLVIEEICRLKKDKHQREKDSIIISTNIPTRNDGMPYADYGRRVITDKGVAVYFRYNGEDMVICCDKWNTIEDNMHAIYLTIEAMRGMERWGVSDFIQRSFTGFKALPEPASQRLKWWQVLLWDKMPNVSVMNWQTTNVEYKNLAKKYHPDAGGDAEKFKELNAAYEEAKVYFGV